MIQNTMKWGFLFLFAVLILKVFTKSLPIEKSASVLVLPNISLPKLKMLNLEGPKVISDSETKTFKSDVAENARPSNEAIFTEDVSNSSTYCTRSLTRNIRPGQVVHRYLVKISFGDDTFDGVAEIDVQLGSHDDSIKFHIEGLDIGPVLSGLHLGNMGNPSDIIDEDGILEIVPRNKGIHQIVVIEYSGEITNFGKGIFRGSFDD